MSNRFKNQKGLIDDDKLGRTRFVVVGAGAIGGTLTIALSKMGARNITCYDYDTVEDHNLANQNYPKSMLGKAKVIALKEIAADYGDCDVVAINEPWTPDNAVECDIVISAVDNMEVRASLFKYYCGVRVVTSDNVGGAAEPRSHGIPRLFIDGRMGPFVYKVYGVDTANVEAVKLYEASLHSQASGSQEKCGEKSIIYTVYQVAAQMLSQIRAFTMDEHYRPTEIIYDAFNDEVFKQYTVERKLEILGGEDEEAEPAAADANEGVSEVLEEALPS